jgi:formiminoglutamase
MPVTHTPAAPWTGRTDPEDGDSAKRIYHHAAESGETAEVGILGFACEAGVARNKGRTGAALGPAAIRKALSGLAAPAPTSAFADYGDVAVSGDDLEDGQAALGDLIAKHLPAHKRMLVFGGGHETAYGSFRGLRAHVPGQRIGIINFDAHLDIRNIGDAGPSSGTPFNQIRALGPETFDYLCLGVAEESNTRALIDRAADWGVQTISDHALIANRRAADAAIADIAARNDALYLTIDLDVLPHFQAPGVSAPASRGVPFAVIEHLVEQVLAASKSCRLGMPLADIVEISPPHDVSNATARTAAVLARRLMQV